MYSLAYVCNYIILQDVKKNLHRRRGKFRRDINIPNTLINKNLDQIRGNNRYFVPLLI